MPTAHVLLSFCHAAAYQVNGEACNCHLRELDLCAATLLLFNQNPSGVATTDAEVDKQCGFLKESQDCFRNFTTRCATPLQRELIGFVAEGSQELFKQFCTKGTEVRTSKYNTSPFCNRLGALTTLRIHRVLRGIPCNRFRQCWLPRNNLGRLFPPPTNRRCYALLD